MTGRETLLGLLLGAVLFTGCSEPAQLPSIEDPTPTTTPSASPVVSSRLSTSGNAAESDVATRAVRPSGWNRAHDVGKARCESSVCVVRINK